MLIYCNDGLSSNCQFFSLHIRCMITSLMMSPSQSHLSVLIVQVVRNPCINFLVKTVGDVVFLAFICEQDTI
uniref:Uncharacterized protein n=1 Tax=Octopus bimaculoides TaxID=37653 RepID=A0A0L8H814_OCTBM